MATRPHIWMIGAGNMGAAMLARWLKAGYTPEQFTIIKRQAGLPASLSGYPLTVYTDIAQAKTVPDVIVLAIKPQQFTEQLTALRAALGAHQAVLVSVMAGVNMAALQGLGSDLTIVRMIPNTPSAIGAGVSAIYAENPSAAVRALAEQLAAPLGHYYWCETQDGLHHATAISGSGSAYVFSFLHALEQAALARGLAADIAHASALQTLKGAVLLAEQTGDDFMVLADQVTSPNGTTRAARNVLDDRLKTLIMNTTDACLERSIELEKTAKISQ